jgi:hypothetical protein
MFKNAILVMFIQGVLRPFELIFCILDIQKSELVEVTEVMFKLDDWA